MKKSPNKYKYSVVDPGGFFEKNKVKPIMNESDATAFKMKGFPQHAGVSPMRQGNPDDGGHFLEKKNRGPVPEETFAESKYGKYQKKSLTVSSKSKKESDSKETYTKGKMATDLVESVGVDLAKAAAVTAVGKMFEKKKKESTRIISKDWKIV